MFERYTESARRTLFFARYEASQLGSISIETEHVLLGILRENKGLAGRMLADMQLSAKRVRRDIETRSTWHEKIPTSVEMPFSAETKRVLHYAAEEADRLGHNYIGTEHLLVGLMREERSTAASILAAHGAHIDGARSTIVRLLHEHSTAPLPADFAEQVERIKQLVDQLGRASSEASEARTLVQRISDELTVLRRSLAQ